MAHETIAEMLELILRKLDQLQAQIDDLKPTAKQRLSLREAALRTGCSTDTIRRACQRRELRYSQNGQGAAIRIAVQDLEAWLDRQSVPIARPRLARPR